MQSAPTASCSIQALPANARRVHPAFRSDVNSAALATQRGCRGLKHRRIVTIAAAQAAVVADTRLPRWDYIYSQLTEKGVKTIKPAEAADLIKKGYARYLPFLSCVPIISVQTFQQKFQVIVFSFGGFNKSRVLCRSLSMCVQSTSTKKLILRAPRMSHCFKR